MVSNSFAAESCQVSLSRFLNHKVIADSKFPDIQQAVQELYALGNTKTSKYFVSPQNRKLSNGAIYKVQALNVQTKATFYKDMDKLIVLQERLEGLDIAFYAWWKANREAMFAIGMMQNVFAQSTGTLRDAQLLLFLQWVAQRGTVEKPGWMRRVLMKFHPTAIVGTVLIAPVTWLALELKSVMVIGTGVQIYNAYTAPVTAPIVNKAGQNGAQQLSGLQEIVNQWVSGRPDIVKHRKELQDVVDEMGKYNFDGKRPEEVRAYWEDLEANRLFPLMQRMQQAMPTHLREARAHYRDLVLQSPVMLAASISQFDSHRMTLQDKLDVLDARALSGSLSKDDLVRRDDLRDAIKDDESSIAAALVSWKLIALMYPDVARDPGNSDAAHRLQNNYLIMSRSLGFNRYAKLYRESFFQILRQMDVEFITQEEVVKSSDAGSNLIGASRQPNAVGKTKVLNSKKQKLGKNLGKKKKATMAPAPAPAPPQVVVEEEYPVQDAEVYRPKAPVRNEQ